MEWDTNAGNDLSKENANNSKLEFLTATEFYTDTLKPLCDWLTVTKSIADWLRAPSSWNQLKNPLKRNGTVTKTRISTTSWTEPAPFPGNSSR